MDESKAMQITYEVMTDRGEILVNIEVRSALFVVSALQLAKEHPHIHPYLVQEIEGIVDCFGQQIVGIHPDAKKLVRNRDIMQLDIFNRIMADKTRVMVRVDVHQAWLTISCAQLVTRHPDLNDEVKTEVVNMAHQFQDAIVELHPGAEQLIQMGWDTSYDVGK